MLISMTGFASKTIELTNEIGERAYLTITIKSLNSRFFEVSTKLPFALQGLEVDIISSLKQLLHRGKVTLSIHSSNPNLFKGPIQPSLATIKSYLDATQNIQKTFSIKGELTIADLTKLPDVLIAQEAELDEKKKNLIIHAINDVAQMLLAVEKNEGTALARDLQERANILEKTITEIAAIAATLMQQRQETCAKKIAELAQTGEAADSIRAQLMIDVDRATIHEEVVRFTSHLKSLHALLTSKTVEKGRQLDFITQEFSREINTIAAKCNDFTISSHAIAIKVELEKIREQAQNIV